MANSKDVVVTGSPPELAGESQGCLFQRDFACSAHWLSVARLRSYASEEKSCRVNRKSPQSKPI